MEENNSIVNNELKDMRIRENPIEISGSLLVDDRLEEQGTIKIYEYIGGGLYIWSQGTYCLEMPHLWHGFP